MMLKLFMAILLLVNVIEAKKGKEDDVEVPEDIKPSVSRTVYDQRQAGKYNVHVNIKDVHFFNLKDSISSLGDYGAYDYEDYGGSEGSDGDYDISHLTVNPILALLGSKPTKPSTTTLSSTEKSETTSVASDELTSTFSTSHKEESTTEKRKLETVTANSLTSSTTTKKTGFKPIQVNETIDYEEIPVEVQYYRVNQGKLPSSSLQHNKHAFNNLKRHRRPSVVQILDGRTNNNVKILESDEQERTVKICGRGEYRDSNGRCRLRAKGRNRVHGLRRVFNILSSMLPKS